MVQSDLHQTLPTSDELLDSDGLPMDNEDQFLLPSFLIAILNSIWASRQDWFFTGDMGIYHTTGANPRVPIVPDAFLALGVERRKGGKSRKSYILWEENNTPPILALELVSQTPGDEYDSKLEAYAKLGILYYIIYNRDYWQRDSHQPFEVYKLVQGTYQLQIGEPYWMPEVGLGIGRFRRLIGGIDWEVLYWYDAQGNRHLASDEREALERQRADQERQRADQERQAKEHLIERLKSLGADPEV